MRPELFQRSPMITLKRDSTSPPALNAFDRESPSKNPVQNAVKSVLVPIIENNQLNIENGRLAEQLRVTTELLETASKEHRAELQVIQDRYRGALELLEQARQEHRAELQTLQDRHTGAMGRLHRDLTRVNEHNVLVAQVMRRDILEICDGAFFESKRIRAIRDVVKTFNFVE
jgi:hypothetical protein